MSIPVEACEPLIGPSTAITPALGDPLVELEDEQPAATIAPVASAKTALTRDGKTLKITQIPSFNRPGCHAHTRVQEQATFLD
jgi:hypothetical protein